MIPASWIEDIFFTSNVINPGNTAPLYSSDDIIDEIYDHNIFTALVVTLGFHWYSGRPPTLSRNKSNLL